MTSDNINPQSITKKTATNIGWNYLSFGLSKALGLLTISILAHILPPQNFGLVALATLAIDYLSIFSDLGLGSALVQMRGKIDKASDTVFSINLLTGITLSIITFLIAPLAASFFREPGLTSVLRWLGLSFTLNAIGTVHNMRLQRNLNFRKKLIPDLGNTLIKGLISIALALSGFGVWSLVIGQLVGTGVSATLLWIVVPWRPQFKIHKELTRKLFSFGLTIMGDNTLAVLGDGFDYFIIGRIFNAKTLGVYTLAYRLPELLVINTLWVIAAVLYPAFSEIQNKIETLQKNFLQIIRYVEIIVVPICLGLMIAADPIVRVVFGEQWLDAIPIIRVLSIYALIFSIGFHSGDIYKAIGRPDILLKTAIPVFVIRIIALWLGAQISLLGVAIAHLMSGVIEITIRLLIVNRILKIHIKDIFAQFRAFIAGAALIFFGFIALSIGKTLIPLLQLLLVITMGGVAYIIAIWFLERDTVQPLLETVINRLKTQKEESR